MLALTHFENWQFSCHNFGNIHSKSGKLTETAKTELDKIFVEQWHGFKREFTSKEIEKGIANEIDGLELLKGTLEPTMILTTPNKKKYSNDFLKGTPDKITGGYVYDIKCSWDLETYERAELTWVYEWQLKCYMWLTGVNKARLFYALTNTHDNLIERETRYFTETQKNNFCKFHNFDKYELIERFKYFEVELSENDIESIQKSVIQAREYLNDLVVKKKTQVITNQIAIDVANHINMQVA